MTRTRLHIRPRPLERLELDHLDHDLTMRLLMTLTKINETLDVFSTLIDDRLEALDRIEFALRRLGFEQRDNDHGRILQ